MRPRLRRFGPRPSVRNRLVLLFFVITAAAIGFIYLYVVPQLRSSLTSERLDSLEQVGEEQSRQFSAVIDQAPSATELGELADAVARRSEARVTLLGLYEGARGLEPGFVIADSAGERSAQLPDYPAAEVAAQSGEPVSGVERVTSERIGQAALPIAPPSGPPAWVAVLSVDLAPVDATVALIRRQILIAGGIALVLALAAGAFAARAHSRRLRRLEAAAEKISHGDFSTPIPVERADEVGQLAITFNEMRERLAQLDNARKEFIANASHELRTPIFSLGGFIELLDEDDPDPESRAEFVRMMRGQIDRLTKLTADLLDLSKLDSGAIGLRAESVEISALARRVASDFTAASELRGSPIEVEASASIHVRADRERLEQVLRILIDNALIHTPRRTPITVSAGLDADGPRLAVIDRGPGIPGRARSRVFERFFVGDEAGGSGLGLAIAAELIGRMGGRLDLHSRGRRTEFELRLPAAADARAVGR